MIISRAESDGTIKYDTKLHRFFWDGCADGSDMPIPASPLVINIDLTLKCNMDCIHCVAADMVKTIGSEEAGELVVSDDLLDRINASPFLVAVITGGEPLLKEKENDLVALLSGIKDKGLIIDTNATVLPSKKLLSLFKKHNVLVRMSWDTPIPSEEVKLRKTPVGMYSSAIDVLEHKEQFIRLLVDNGIPVAVQTVIHKMNHKSTVLLQFPHKLAALGVKRWVLQRFIPSHKMLTHMIKPADALVCMRNLSKVAAKVGIACEYKADLRHNSVFLLVGDGQLYTQSNDQPGKKVHLGKIGDANYFTRVSSVDHADRYLKHSADKR